MNVKEETHDHDIRKPERRRHDRRAEHSRSAARSIRLFCDASLDYNPLHLDDDYMKGNFGKTNFGGIIMHGMNNFGLISRMITDWAYPAGAIHRAAGDAMGQAGQARRHHPADRHHQVEADHDKSRWVLIDVMVRNQTRREGRHRRGHGRIPDGVDRKRPTIARSCFAHHPKVVTHLTEARRLRR